MRSLLCLNGRGRQLSVAEIVQAIDLLGSRYVLLEGEPGQANEVARQRPNVQVIYRVYWPPVDMGDDDLHRKVSAATWITHMNGLGLDAGIWWYCGNEPTGAWEGLAAFLIEAMRMATALGRVLVVGNFSVGVPEPEDWRGPLLPLLAALAGSNHVLGLHEYIVGALALSQPHYVGRFQEVLKALAERGLGRIRLLITEFGFDLKGSWQKLGLSAAQFAAAVYQACLEYRTAGVLGVCLFCFGQWSRGAPGTPEYTGEFDVRPALGELARIAGQLLIPDGTEDGESGEDDGMDTVTWIPGKAEPYGQYFVNLRAEPVATAARPGKIQHGDLVEFYPVRGDWWQVRMQYDGKQVQGWAHVGYVEIKPDLSRWNDGGQGDTESPVDPALEQRIADLERMLAEEQAALVAAREQVQTAERERDSAVAALTPYRDAVTVINSLTRDALDGVWTGTA